MDQLQRKHPSLMDKYKNCTYKTSSFRGGSNIDFSLIMCEYKTVITLILQSYVLNNNCKYLLHARMDITKKMISKHLCWCGIRKAIRKEVNNFDTCQCTKRSNIKYGKLQAKVYEELPLN